MFRLSSLLLLAIVLFLSQCISDKKKGQGSASFNPTEVEKENINLRQDSFSVNGLVFLGKPLDTSARISCSCPKGYQSHYNNDLIRQMVSVYDVQQDIEGYLLDSAFFTKFMINEPTTNFETEDTNHPLGSPIIKEAEIGNYGKCVIASFHFDSAPSALQEYPTVVVNRSKKEASLWYFNNFKVRKGVIEVDLKVRNYNHGFILVQYDTVSGSFVETCHKSVIEAGY